MGSDSKKNSGDGNVQGEGGSQIPAAAKKMVQSLKEIVGNRCTDAEIYAVLLDCNMEPGDAVPRLLSQDTFHKVKSKRERRKEVKETQDSRTRNNSGASNLGVRTGSEHAAGWSGSTEDNYNELGKASNERENRSAAPSVSVPSSDIYRPSGKISNEKPLPHSASSNADNRRQSIGAGDTITSPMQLSSGLQPSWSGVSKGHVSMVDIVKRGLPLSKRSQMSTDSEMHQDRYSSHPSNVPETIHESGMTAGQHGFDNKWSVYENLTADSGSYPFDASAASDAEVYSNQSSLHRGRADLSRNSQSQERQVSDRDVDSQNHNSNHCGFNSADSRQIFVNHAGGASNDDSLKETSSYASHGHMHKYQEGMSNSFDLPFPSHSASLIGDVLSAVSPTAANLQQLNIGMEEPAKPLTEVNSDAVLPNYLQATAADCSHLSFGTYKSGVASPPTVPTSFNNSSKSDLEASAVVDGLSALHRNIRNSGYQDDAQPGFMGDTHRASAASRKYESQISYPKPKPSELLASTVQSLRARDSSSFLAAQSKPLRYNAVMSSINSPISMSEVLNSSTYYSLPPPASQALPGSNRAKGNVLPQHLSVNPYSQPELSLRELTNMTGYPSMPHSQKYVPSASLQAYPDSSAFNDSLAGMNYNLAQYRSSAAMNTMHLPNSSNAGYRSFVGSSANLPESFLHSLSTSQIGTGAGYDDNLRSQFNDANVIPRQRNSGFSAWEFGNDSRTMPMHPESAAYYSLLGQNPRQAGYHQQASQQYESIGGYPKIHPSRTGIGREQQQQHQNLGDFTLTDSQGTTTSNQLNQSWGHHNYRGL